MDQAAVDLDEILVVREDLEDLAFQAEVVDLECRGYPAVLADPVVLVALAALGVVPPEEVPLEAVVAAVEEVALVHPLPQSST